MAKISHLPDQVCTPWIAYIVQRLLVLPFFSMSGSNCASLFDFVAEVTNKNVLSGALFH